MKKTFFSRINKVVIIGSGGNAAYYIAKFLRYLDIYVDCFEISPTNKTKELESMGCNFTYENPTDFVFDEYDLIIYTQALPKELISKIENNNPKYKIYTTGHYYSLIIENFKKGLLKTDIEKEAITKSNIAPLFDLDFSNIVLIGVTGSKGKTTTSYMIYETLLNLGVKVSCCTTIGAKILDKDVETGLHTSTPSAQELSTLFKNMIAAKSEVIVLEVSSHAIATGRIAGLKFDFGVITNLQPEHLDFHKTIEGVIETKIKIVNEYLKPTGIAILNLDDKNIIDKVIPKIKSKKYGITFKDIKANDVELVKITNTKELPNSIQFNIDSMQFKNEITYEVPYPGMFNAKNVLAAAIISRELGYQDNSIKKSVKQLGTVSGRNEVIQEYPFKIILDFAHTPESLEEILKTYKKQLSKKNKLIVVFGAAGNRDSIKRPKMGATAAKYADITILTAEDPRTEDVKKINDSIQNGWENAIKDGTLKNRNLLRIEDTSKGTKCRREAISKAIEIAENGDTIICAGKGPEKSMCIGLEEIPWNEKEVILNLLKQV